jgi:hypothetical protein
MTCPTCGAAVRPDASWCGQCHGSVNVAEVAAPVRSAPVQEQPGQTPSFSRWRGGATSMGPFGRVAWTVFMLAFGVLFLWSGNPFAIGPWWLIAMPLVLRSVWARKRIT